MTNLLVKLFVRNFEKADAPEVRTRFGILSGAVGIALNLTLCCAKLIVGSFSNSIAITADAVNNLSDAGSSVVNIVGFRLAAKSADDEHPFGHGRLEYICALIVAFFVLLMGVELVKSSLSRILHPEPTVFSIYAVIILCVSILAKLWLACFNRNIGKRIHSPAMGAIVADSMGDMAATGVTLLALVLSKFTSLPLDGYMGIAVAIFVFLAGINIVRDTVGPLLGESADSEFVEKIEDKILSYDGVVGIHDLILHNYGPGRNFGSVHAEVPSDIDIIHSHDTIDLIERDIKRMFSLDLVIHLDPIIVNDEKIDKLKAQTTKLVNTVDPQLSIHDFRVVEGPTHTNLIFDVVTPHKYPMKKSDLLKILDDKIDELGGNYYAVITVEQSFVKTI